MWVGPYSKKTFHFIAPLFSATLYGSCPQPDWSPGEIWHPVWINILSYYSLFKCSLQNAGWSMEAYTELQLDLARPPAEWNYFSKKADFHIFISFPNKTDFWAKTEFDFLPKTKGWHTITILIGSYVMEKRTTDFQLWWPIWDALCYCIQLLTFVELVVLFNYFVAPTTFHSCEIVCINCKMGLLFATTKLTVKMKLKQIPRKPALIS